MEAVSWPSAVAMNPNPLPVNILTVPFIVAISSPFGFYVRKARHL